MSEPQKFIPKTSSNDDNIISTVQYLHNEEFLVNIVFSYLRNLQSRTIQWIYHNSTAINRSTHLCITVDMVFHYFYTQITI